VGERRTAAAMKESVVDGAVGQRLLAATASNSAAVATRGDHRARTDHLGPAGDAAASVFVSVLPCCFGARCRHRGHPLQRDGEARPDRCTGAPSLEHRASDRDAPARRHGYLRDPPAWQHHLQDDSARSRDRRVSSSFPLNAEQPRREQQIPRSLRASVSRRHARSESPFWRELPLSGNGRVLSRAATCCHVLPQPPWLHLPLAPSPALGRR
jgi:hypothetical protein